MKKLKYLKKVYSSNGGAVYRKFLNRDEKKILTSSVMSVTSKYLQKHYKSINDKKFHEVLSSFRKKYPKKFGQMYDELALNSKLRSIFYTKKFLDFSSKILNTTGEKIFINGFMLRLDGPYDERNKLDWHQDAPYYLQTSPRFDAFVCWLPIIKNTQNNGSLIYLKRSHKKLLKAKLFRKSKLHSAQYRIQAPKKSQSFFDLDFGDLSIFHMLTVHKSGKNLSNKFRINFGCRVHKITSKFNVGKEKYFFNKTNKEIL